MAAHSSFHRDQREAARPIIEKLRAGQLVDKKVFFSLPLEAPSSAAVDALSFAEVVAAVESHLKILGATPVNMEDAAAQPMEYCLVPFPIAVAFHVAE